MKFYIDITTLEKKQEVYNLFDSFTKKGDIYEYYHITDNSSNVHYINYIANEIGFDFAKYRKQNNDKFCLNCGKKLNDKQKKFCSCSCAVSYNNKKRKMTDITKEKISNALRKKNNTEEKARYCLYCNKRIYGQNQKFCSNECRKSYNVDKDRCNNEKKYTVICQECGKTFQTKNYESKFCSRKCITSFQHKMAYKDFLENNDKYCRPNYTPKPFKNDFLNEQGGKCEICGCEPFHNGKPLIFILDHIDGDASNNKRENLRMICPNCDTQLPTFKSKNKHSTRRKYWKEHILKEKYGDLPKLVKGAHC